MNASNFYRQAATAQAAYATELHGGMNRPGFRGDRFV